MSRIESPCWRPFTDGGFKRQVDGLDVAGWGIFCRLTRQLCPNLFLAL